MKLTLLIAGALLMSSSALAQTDSSKIYFDSGTVKYELKLYSAARLYFENAIRVNPSFTGAYIMGARADAQTGRAFQARQKLEKAHQLKPSDSEIAKMLMDWDFSHSHYKLATETAETCKCEGADKVIGISAFYLEDYGKAEEYLKKSLKNDPDDALVNYILGETYLELDNLKEAIAYYQKAIELDPQQAGWQYEFALLLYNSNNFKSALTYFDAAEKAGLQVNLDFTENKGFCLIYAGKVKEGEYLLEKVLEKKPDNKRLLNDIAFALFSAQNFEEAIRYYDKVYSLDSQDAKSLYMVGVSLIRMGQNERGKATCEQAIKIDPTLANNRRQKSLPMGL